MSLYNLTRDDGARLFVPANAWEAALELAYLYGWRPAGTESPSSAPSAWDAQDYFTQQRQRVRSHDARALGLALERALRGFPPGDSAAPESVPIERSSPMPSRSAAHQAGLNLTQRSALDRFAAFALHGGFTIHGG
jgi:hypothetical protein